MNPDFNNNLPAEPPPEPPLGFFPNNDPLSRYRKYNVATAIFVVVGLIMTAGIIFKNVAAKPETKAAGFPSVSPTPVRFGR